VQNAQGYAQIHNEGGKITQTPTDRQRAFFWSQYYLNLKKKKAKGEVTTSETEVSKRWKSMALAKQLNITMPQRQFMDIPNQAPSKGTIAEIHRQLDNEIKRILK
jgi:phage gpG-like protein